MTRIAYINADPGVPAFGRKGCSVHVQEVLRALSRAGAEIVLFTRNTGGVSAPGLENVRVCLLPAAPKGDLAFREQQCLATNERMRALLEKERPFNLVYERYSLWSYAAMEYARGQRVPALLEVNAPLIEEQAEFRGLVDRAGALAAARRVFGAATALFAVSNEVAQYLNLFSETQGKVEVTPNAVNPDRFPAGLRPTRPARPGTFTVGFVGSMKPWHGVEDLVAAFARLRPESGENRLLLVGDGPTRTQLETQVRAQRTTERVHFAGAVEPAEVPGLLASTDVAVAPYRPSSQFYFSPLKVYEYMAAGLPVVASALGQLNQLIEPEINGLLVPPGDVLALANALQRLRQDPEKRALLGRAGRRKVFAQHTWDALAQRILGLARPSLGQHLENSSSSLRHAAT